MFDLTGRTALVTGAGQGVGRGIALALAQRGAAVAVNDLFLERAADTVKEIEAAGGRAIASAFDVTDYAACRAAMREVASSLAPIDILVNNAGVPPGMGVEPFRETAPEDWKRYIDLNVYGVMNCCHLVVESMRERGYGRVVTISSGAGTTGIALGVAAYGAGKGGGIGFMRHFAMENADAGITANTVAVGLIDNHLDPSVTAHMAKGVPVGRLGKPEDIAALCLYLASEEAGWMTGQTVELNGGSTTT